ncbi:hypothetical protein EJ110_NYTH52870 [Nymphaea thermarum]|nr:hypothetical protein EJ110_NYTH52870 [Nymphaea thermarum]
MEDAEEGYGDPHEEEESEGEDVQLEEEYVGVSLGTTKGKGIMHGGGSSATATRKRRGASISSVSRGGDSSHGRTSGGRIIDERWSGQLHRPLHAAAYYLNPAIRYLPTFKKDREVEYGMLDCIDVLVSDSKEQDAIHMSINKYDTAFGTMARDTVVRCRTTMRPDSWVEEEPFAILDEDDLDFLNVEGAAEIIEEGEVGGGGGSNGMSVTFHLQ